MKTTIFLLSGLLLMMPVTQASLLQIDFTGEISNSTDIYGTFFPTNPSLGSRGRYGSYINTALGDAISGQYLIEIDGLGTDQNPSPLGGLYTTPEASRGITFTSGTAGAIGDLFSNLTTSSITYGGNTFVVDTTQYPEYSDVELITIYNDYTGYDQFRIDNRDIDKLSRPPAASWANPSRDDTRDAYMFSIFSDFDATMLSSDVLQAFTWTADGSRDVAWGRFGLLEEQLGARVQNYSATYNILSATASIVGGSTGGSGSGRNLGAPGGGSGVNPVPEPGTLALFSLGLFSLVAAGRKKPLQAL